MTCSLTDARGWYRDPFGLHQDRYFSQGRPTKLVRDGSLETYDPPPRGRRMRLPLAEVTETSPQAGPATQRRADDLQRSSGPFDACRTVFDTLARCLGTD